ncbi:MAG: MBL fold metallo-hydrolase, partial [Alphaproteobacteria bacterium]|nr:MBL fold metallo-hydrolase [Alphaproteobacteria bacterium]
HVAALIEHRLQREVAIAAALRAGTDTIADIVADMYKDVSANLHPAAARVVHAHLVHMIQTGRAACDGPPTEHATYEALD